MLDFKKIENICAIVMLVAFFLPWVSFMGLSAAGYSIVGTLNNLLSFGGESVPWQVYLIFLVPLAAVGVLVTDFLKTDEKIARIVAIVAGVIPVAGIIYLLIQTEGQGFQALALGAYLTIIAAVVMLLAVFGIVKMPK